MHTIPLNTVVWKEGKYYVSQCLNVDVSSFGTSRKEALDNLNEALELYFEDEQVPIPSKIERPEIVPLRLRHG
jgi:predicted RNase H-like HicB family nuclease